MRPPESWPSGSDGGSDHVSLIEATLSGVRIVSPADQPRPSGSRPTCGQSTTALMAMLSALVASPADELAVTVNVEVPVAVGVPEIVPVVGPSVSPAGSEPAVIDHVKGKLANFKVPKRVVFLGELPRNAMGKVLKTDLRAKHG
jgi:acyl-CoA synthetase (AMP-forming)/AMP-acid ligase II